MKKIIIFLVSFILISSQLFAEDFNWTLIEKGRDGTKYYIDLSSIKKSGNGVYFFYLSDNARPHPEYGIMSSTMYVEGNCSSMNARFLKDFHYDFPMGKGNPKNVYNKVGEWYDFKRESIGNTLLKFACSYRQ